MADQILTLRQVREDDCEMLWHWVNQPEVRASAFCSEPIPWEEHQIWFRKKMADPSCYIFIALNEDKIPIGQIRFDPIDQENLQIDISIEDLYRGSGYGTLLILLGVKKILNIDSSKIINAFIRPENKTSIKVFKKADFQYLQSKIVNGIKTEHYQKQNQ
ncbi:surface polysaccharide biosynthesis protein, transferase (plasmid) [[Synechococcus] sp. NIES-970]|nr:surface polysaccharide biosynthesis protein, transferase [[Synechococcus] sp. NIES-970]